ncbi:hypothetical protein ABT093_09625 [Kitasatospora sp. NPDC002551]|uniref:hypothetical protein n=1 Tax=Kitasatospora sp. NPDC002551 TaxID=3154539 RepID=UPI0033237F9C
MTTRTAWLLPRSGAGGQTREDTRLAPIGTMTPAGILTTRGGVLAGAGYAVTGSGMTATVGIGRGVVQGTTTQGPIPVVTTSAETVPIPDGTGQPRIDLIIVRVYENIYDAQGLTLAKTERVAGTPNASPVAPTPPAASIVLAQVRVEATSSAGNPINWGTNLTDRRSWTVAAGGIMPDSSSTPGVYVGQYRDGPTGLERWNGTAWVSQFPPLTSTFAESTTSITITSPVYVAGSPALSATCVVPPSGKVMVIGQTRLYVNAAGASVFAGLHITGSDTIVIRTVADSTALQSVHYATDAIIPGTYSARVTAVPGEVLTAQWQFRVTAGAGAAIDHRNITLFPLAG